MLLIIYNNFSVLKAVLSCQEQTHIQKSTS